MQHWHLSQWHASELTRATDCALWHSIKCGLLWKKKNLLEQVPLSSKRLEIHTIFASHCVFLLVLFVSVPIKRGERRSVTNEGTRPHPVCTHAMRWMEESAVYKQTELKGLMDHTAYLIIEKQCGPAADPCRYDSAFCRRTESLPLASTCWRRAHRHSQTDRQGRGAAASDSLAVARETMSSQLTPVTDDITCPNRLEKPEMTWERRWRACVRVCARALVCHLVKRLKHSWTIFPAVAFVFLSDIFFILAKRSCRVSVVLRREDGWRLRLCF